jgi:putrescine transport system ATP-binding protein
MSTGSQSMTNYPSKDRAEQNAGAARADEGFVRIVDVVKTFGETAAVRQLSLDIRRGEIFALLGSSGCGKSTLLRMLAGFEPVTAGRIVINGEDMTALPPYRRPVNMMFQSYALFPHTTVEANVAFGLRQEGRPKSEIRDRVAEALALVQMGAYAKRKPHQLCPAASSSA